MSQTLFPNGAVFAPPHLPRTASPLAVRFQFHVKRLNTSRSIDNRRGSVAWSQRGVSVRARKWNKFKSLVP